MTVTRWSSTQQKRGEGRNQDDYDCLPRRVDDVGQDGFAKAYHDVPPLTRAIVLFLFDQLVERREALRGEMLFLKKVHDQPFSRTTKQTID